VHLRNKEPKFKNKKPHPNTILWNQLSLNKQLAKAIDFSKKEKRLKSKDLKAKERKSKFKENLKK
jgi:hypothetical protein